MFGKSWKTTILGILTILGTLIKLFIDLANGSPVNLEVTLAGLSAGIGLLLAKDFNISGSSIGKVFALFITTTLLFSLAACGSWQKTTVVSYDVGSITLKVAKDTSKLMCDNGQLNSVQCERLKNYYNKARISFIVAGDILKLIVQTDDSMKDKELKLQYQIKIDDFKKMGNDFFDLAYQWKITEKKFVIK